MPGVLHLNDSPLYAAIAGVQLPRDQFDLGAGIMLSRTYAHLMAPFLAAFTLPPSPGAPHPAPWKAVGGGFSFDVNVQLYIPLSYSGAGSFDRLHTIWWLASLMRLRATPLVTVPVVANHEFATMPAMEGEPTFWPVEFNPQHLVLERDPRQELDVEALEWVKRHWLNGAELSTQSPDFGVAFQAWAQSMWSADPSLALLSLWGALERLFAPSHSELRFRVSATIASYITLPGNERLQLYKCIKRLYDARSKAAHGSGSNEFEALVETYALTKRVLMKMIEENHVQSDEELEARVFGDASGFLRVVHDDG